MKKAYKSGLIALCVSCAMCASIGAMTVTASADDYALDGAAFTMTKGAAVRVGGTEKADNGLRFEAGMPKADYEALMAQVGDGKKYSDVEFGMLIAPTSYTEIYALTEENCFTGARVWYKYSDEADADGLVRAQILNLTTDSLAPHEKDADRYVYRGAIVDIKDTNGVSNLSRAFTGQGYVKCTLADGSVDYLFATPNENSRTITYVATKALEDPNRSENLTEENCTWLTRNYTSAYFCNSSVYAGDSKNESILLSEENPVGGRTEGMYYKMQARQWNYEVQENRFVWRPTYPKSVYQAIYALDNNAKLTFDYYFTKKEGDTVTQSSFIMTPSGITNQGAIQPNTWYEEFVPISEILNRWDAITGATSATSGALITFNAASATTATNPQYNQYYIGNFGISVADGVDDGIENLVDVKGKTTVDLGDYVTVPAGISALTSFNKELSYHLTAADGSTVLTEGGTVSVDSLKSGLYTCAIEWNGLPITKTTIDVYNSNDPVELGTESVNANYAGGTVTSNATAPDGTRGVFKLTGVSQSEKYWGVKPMHSKAYYELYADYNLTYDIYTDTTATNGGTVQAVRHNYFMCYGNGADGSALATLGKWYDVSTKHADTKKTVQWLLDNWTEYNAGTKGLYGSICNANIDGTTNAANMANVVFYIKVRIYPTFTAVTDTASNLVDVNTTQTVDLNDYITEAGKELIAQYGVSSYLLTPVDGSTVKYFDSNIVNVEEVDLRAYTLSVLYGATPMYSGTVIDFYDSTQEVVLGSQGVLYTDSNQPKGTMTVNATAPDGTTGCFKITDIMNGSNHFAIKLQHTKAYYELYATSLISYKVYTDPTVANSEATIEYINMAYMRKADQTNVTVGKWFDTATWLPTNVAAKSTVQWFVDNWDNYTKYNNYDYALWSFGNFVKFSDNAGFVHASDDARVGDVEVYLQF